MAKNQTTQMPPANDNHFILVANAGASRDVIRNALAHTFADLAREGYDDAVVFEEAFSLLTDLMYRSAQQRPKESYWCAYERYNQAVRFSGKLELLTFAMQEHYLSNIYD
ncbi:MAG: hypothetical protein CMK09_00620 [Ponticaulis sp.]|nr:hypothetical protein [Ponticaulis sp.]|tara:strand:- start:1048 stop:1377 length:330 start_codon:yes stop_codon:yes gene_type:complete